MEASQVRIKSETQQLVAADGFPLMATTFTSQAQSGVKAKGKILIAGATAVPQGFYRRFAEFAVEQGYAVMTLDYRGVGLSKPASLKGFEMNYLDWATLDLAAAVDAFADDTPLFLVGHSFGGHAFGLLPNHQKIARFYTFGSGAGWHGWMPKMEQVKVLFMWRVLGPLLTRWKGYLPWKMLGMGEDLPLGVFKQWKHWCQFPHYFFDDPAMPHVAEKFAQINTPIIAANALDDLWAPPRSRDAFMQAYRNTEMQFIDIDPRITGAMGHMGYFRLSAQPLWADVLTWFSSHKAS